MILNWLTTGDPASSRGRSSMAIKLDDTDDEKVRGQISIKESRMGEQNAWRGKTSLMYDTCIWAYMYMYVLWGLYLLSREFCACKWKVQIEKSSVCLFYTFKRFKFQTYGRMKLVKCFLKVPESLKYILHVSIMCCKTDSCGFDSAYKKKYPPFFGQSF